MFAEELAGALGPYVELQFGRRRMQGAPEIERPVPNFAALLEEEIAGLAEAVEKIGTVVVRGKQRPVKLFSPQPST